MFCILRYQRLMVPFCLVAAGLMGCGGETVKLHNLSGTVTFDGKPVPAGNLMITPDGSKNNSGAAGVAVIKDGKFDTAAEGGRGHQGGDVIIRIEGYETAGESKPDPELPDQMITVTTPLFSTYEMRTSIPSEDSTLNIDVPPEAAQRKDVPEGGAGGGSGGV